MTAPTPPRLPRIAAPAGKEGSLDPSDFIAGHTPQYGAVLGGYGMAAMRMAGLAASTKELVRLRNAQAMQCRLCTQLRRSSAVDGGLDEATVARVAAADLDALDPVDRAAVRLVEAYLTTPGAVPADVAGVVRAALTPAQIAEILLSLVVWTGNRVLVALGLDAPVDPAGLTMFDYTPTGVQQYARAERASREEQPS